MRAVLPPPSWSTNTRGPGGSASSRRPRGRRGAAVVLPHPHDLPPVDAFRLVDLFSRARRAPSPRGRLHAPAAAEALPRAPSQQRRGTGSREPRQETRHPHVAHRDTSAPGLGEGPVGPVFDDPGIAGRRGRSPGERARGPRCPGVPLTHGSLGPRVPAAPHELRAESQPPAPRDQRGRRPRSGRRWWQGSFDVPRARPLPGGG